MAVASSFSDYQPIRYVGRVPVYATTILTALFAVALVLQALLLSARVNLSSLRFTAPFFLSGDVWQPLTYAFLGQLSFFTPLGLFCFYSWGIEIERYLGRARFVKFFLLLLLLQPLVLCLWWWGFKVPSTHIGNYQIVAAKLIGFATLYPNIEYLGWIPLKWFAFACVVIGSLMYFPERNWVDLSLLWATCGAAFGYIRFLQAGGSDELGEQFTKLFRRGPKLRVLATPQASGRSRSSSEPSEVDSIDPLLDKIAKSGLESLSAKERARLEQARAALMKKEGR
jgi:hypothetical protein